MATIEDLDQRSISELSVDEALEMLRQIRLSRRTQKSTYKKSPSKAKAKAQSSPTPSKMSPEQARKLLELLGG